MVSSAFVSLKNSGLGRGQILRSLHPHRTPCRIKPTLPSAVSQFGAQAKAKLSNPAASGELEDQLRAPLEALLADLAEACGLTRSDVVVVGETALGELKTRPDYAVTVRNHLAGFVEVKAPGKGADPRRFRGHDKAQWEKLQSLPNLLYTDGNAFSLWHSGEPVGAVVRLVGDVETAGNRLEAPPGLLNLFNDFFQWEPIPPRDARQLAETSARLCGFLRAEVTEQLGLKNAALTSLAVDWRKLLFPEASDEQEVWAFEVSGKHVVRQWFSYRRKSRERPVIGDRRNSDLGKIQPDHWLAEYTTELLNLLHVLGRLVALHPAQADLLARICEGETTPAADLNTEGPQAVAETGSRYGASIFGQLSFF